MTSRTREAMVAGPRVTLTLWAQTTLYIHNPRLGDPPTQTDARNTHA